MAEIDEAPAMGGPLDWLHYNVILASRTGYPIPLMIGFTLYGNVMLRKESGGKPYPNWIFGWPIGLIVYTYPASVFSDLFFQAVPPRILANNMTFFVFSFWFLVIQFCEPVYKFMLRKQVFIVITTWWLADATRVSLLTMERTVSMQPTLARGLWQAFFWCTIVPTSRCIELALRGLPIPKLDQMVPNTVNFFKHPLISMFFLMVSYLMYMAYFTDCNIFATDGTGISMTECGNKHSDVYAAFTYTACVLHLARSFYTLQVEGKLMMGDFLCYRVPKNMRERQHSVDDDLERPLLGSKRS
mmetsp:Transcript_22941/g.51029  ORF Transcript_22941/g.51029 Transcript_22941/m.51029 type:complete len:300 (+) Transcript_22941:60-959(+)